MRAGYLLRKIQQGEKLSMPDSRPMPDIGERCHEVRVRDQNTWWRVIYRTDADAIVIGEVFQKKRNDTSRTVIENCKRRFRDYDNACR